ncbi:3-dehydroquinate synthase [Roseospira visakhapatnamensis]|uniref:3-dehydroquinate synthase n=1 Tax=Roseospira visakhapatnamensis TaxID=390880 RepID=A0A7W6W862_9PROT|nr:3-dehydroquinate synthase [Roseospira visakhapatnamensis]MBB4264665.1 3-dehydroquinate synthase [Roseospira visakhapatnamensis]
MTPPDSAAPPPSDPLTVSVELGARAYPIHIGAGLLARAGALIRARLPRATRAFVVSDATVAPLYLDQTRASLAAAGLAAADHVIPAGEASKSLEHLGAMIEAMLGHGMERGTPVIALGGGVVGDLAGLAAAVALRGVPLVQIPTTLLSQVDSSVGGKTAVNSAHGKNLIGAFHQPVLVLADTDTLDTLPRRDLLAGYAETVKYGLIGDAPFWDWLEGNGPALLDGDAGLRAEAIAVSCRAKAAVVAADEREAGQRALLNLGHTFGHALEAEAGYGDALLHGEGVAIGMVMAFELSHRLGLCPGQDLERVRRHLDAVGLPTRPDPARTWDVDRLIGHMAKDKKVEGGRVTFVLARGIGRAHLQRDVSADAVRDTLSACLA